jgi:hypothetical protein
MSILAIRQKQKGIGLIFAGLAIVFVTFWPLVLHIGAGVWLIEVPWLAFLCLIAAASKAKRTTR